MMLRCLMVLFVGLETGFERVASRESVRSQQCCASLGGPWSACGPCERTQLLLLPILDCNTVRQTRKALLRQLDDGTINNRGSYDSIDVPSFVVVFRS